MHETLRPDVIAVEAGQGHQPVEPGAPDPDYLKLRSQIGQNAFALLSGTTDSESGASAWLSAKVQAEKTGAKLLMPLTQPTFDQEGRGVAQATTMAAGKPTRQAIMSPASGLRQLWTSQQSAPASRGAIQISRLSGS